jgi:tRNA (guanosine-2'-O-)-methyltransferase
MQEKRLQKFKRVARYSQKTITVILENIYDTHNVGAVMRTCDSIGIRQIYLVNTENSGINELVTLGKRSSMGTRKWIDVSYFRHWDDCIKKVREMHQYIIGTYLGENTQSMYSCDFTQNVAIMLGNEKDGLSTEAISHCDQLLYIPQAGMAESLNVSVAAAAILYEAYRQRMLKGYYSDKPELSNAESEALLQTFIDRSEDKISDPRQYKIRPK